MNGRRRGIKPDRNRANRTPPVRRMHLYWLSLVSSLVLRNVIVALIIALSLIYVLYLVLAQPRTNKTVSQSPAPVIQAHSNRSSTTETTPASQAEFRLPPTQQSQELPVIIEPPPEVMAMAMPPPERSVIDGWEYTNYYNSTLAVVESNEKYVHQMITMDEGQYYHRYTFFLACGHTVIVTPDPYRNVMYKDPEQVAARYENMTCASCKALTEKLTTKKAN